MIEEYAARHARTVAKYDLGGNGGAADSNELTYEDIRVTRVIASRISDAQARRMVDLATENRSLWLEVPLHAQLRDADPAIRDGLYDAAAALYRSLQFHGVRNAKASKVLHRKRPALYPLLDTKLKMIYAQSAKDSASDYPERNARRMYWAAIRGDLLKNAKGLRELRRQVETSDLANYGVHKLSDLRLLDMIAWKL